MNQGDFNIDSDSDDIIIQSQLYAIMAERRRDEIYMNAMYGYLLAEHERAKKRRPRLKDGDISKKTKHEDDQCKICYEYENNIQLGCRHNICTECYKKLRDEECPYCRQMIKTIEMKKQTHKRNSWCSWFRFW